MEKKFARKTPAKAASAHEEADADIVDSRYRWDR